MAGQYTYQLTMAGQISYALYKAVLNFLRHTRYCCTLKFSFPIYFNKFCSKNLSKMININKLLTLIDFFSHDFQQTIVDCHD